MAVAAVPDSRFLTLRGMRFHYLDWENAEAQPLLLLHGLTSNAHGWDGLAPAMRERYHVVALDQRGHGETEWAASYRHEEMVEDVDAFVKALGLERFALVAISMGARIAYAYAALHPAEVERLVIVDIGPELDPAGVRRIRGAMTSTDTFDDAEDAFRHLRAADPRPPDRTLRHRVEHGLIQTADGRWTWRYDKGLRNGQRPLTALDPATQWSLLGRIACPTLVVRGGDSDLLARETAERMAGTIPDCRLVEVPKAGHAVPGDDPEGFVEAVRSFLLA